MVKTQDRIKEGKVLVDWKDLIAPISIKDLGHGVIKEVRKKKNKW